MTLIVFEIRAKAHSSEYYYKGNTHMESKFAFEFVIKRRINIILLGLEERILLYNDRKHESLYKTGSETVYFFDIRI